MDASKVAISYIRFSKKIQAKGDSLRRQADDSTDFCKRHGLILDESYTIRDLGVSAFTGANSTTGSLSVFLDLVRTNRVPRGVTLVIEKFDRLSRQQPMRQLALIDELLRAGIRIATMKPDRFYSEEDLTKNPYVIYEILSHTMSGYEESAKKSNRCREAWASKRKLSEATGRKMTSMTPPWLKLSEDRNSFHFIPEKVELMKRIFALGLEGLGCCSIAKVLNGEGIPSPKNKKWSTIYVRLLLKDRRVLGELQSYRLEDGKHIPLGNPQLDYYPRIIDDDTFARIQTSIAGRYQPRGPSTEKWKVNVFKGLLFDARTGGTWGINTFNDRQGRKGVVRLVVRQTADTGGGIKGSLRFDQFETAFFKFVTDLRPSDFSGAESSDSERLATLSSHMTLASQKIEIIDDEIRTTEDAQSIKPLLKLKAKFEHEVEARRNEYEQLKMRLASPAVESVADTQTLIGLLATSTEREALRLKIRARMRQLIESIWLMTYDVSRQRYAVCQVCFHDGTYRTFHAGYTLTRRPFSGDEGCTIRSEILKYDLRTIRHQYPGIAEFGYVSEGEKKGQVNMVGFLATLIDSEGNPVEPTGPYDGTRLTI